MFNSTGNNFGAGVISFKDARESNYVVLNARFTCSPRSPEYKAAEVLEIYVPSLLIDRSAESGVIARFKERETSGSRTYVYDGGTVLKSWIRDVNTLCIEKLPVFDDRDELIIYIQTLYCRLGQGANSSRGKAKKITAISEDGYLSVDTSNTLCIVFNRWVFYHMMIRGVAYDMQDADWEAFFENLPEDVTADVPVVTAYNSRNARLGSISESRVEQGYWTMPETERCFGFLNSSSYIFSFACLVRDSGQDPEIKGRLRIAEDEMRGAQYQYFYDFDLELIPDPALAACSGSTGMYGTTEAALTAPSCPDGMPDFSACFLGTRQQIPGLCIELVRMELAKDSGAASVKLTDCSGMNTLAFVMFDTAVATAL